MSVVIAAKDAAAFVAEAIASALAQTLTALEVIVVDDGSCDDTAAVVQACADGDARVRLLRNDRSEGVSRARNRAICAAHGDWIAILDADDAFLPDRLESMVREATVRGLDMLADNLSLRDFASGASLGVAYPAAWMARPELLTFADLLERDRPGLPQTMFGCVKPLIRRAFLADKALAYRDDVWCAEDFLLYAQAILAGARFGTMNAPLYVYALRGDSVSASGPVAERAAEVARVGRLIGPLACGRPSADRRLLRDRQAQFDYLAFTQLLKAGQVRRAAISLARVPVGFIAKSVLAAIGRRVGVGREPSL